jgi:hypothetical protein
MARQPTFNDVQGSYPASSAPLRLAYDPTRDVVWVTLTATNEVIDPTGGRVLVGSAIGEGIQVISL